MASYDGKYDWKAPDTVKFGDMNRIEIGIRDAVKEANDAHTTARSGVSKADAAQVTANSGVSKADAAQVTANTASASATNANNKIDNLSKIALVSNVKRTLFVQATEPSGAVNGDLWFKT